MPTRDKAPASVGAFSLLFQISNILAEISKSGSKMLPDLAVLGKEVKSALRLFTNYTLLFSSSIVKWLARITEQGMITSRD